MQSAKSGFWSSEPESEPESELLGVPDEDWKHKDGVRGSAAVVGGLRSLFCTTLSRKRVAAGKPPGQLVRTKLQ